MEKAAAGWNALLLPSCFRENVRMISSEFNNDKCSEHDAIAIISILFKEIQRGYGNMLCWVNVCSGTTTKPAHTNTHTSYLDVKLVGRGFMVSCYSITLLSRALVRAAVGHVRWYMMCHCSPNPIFSSPLIGVVFLLYMHDSTPMRKHCSPTFSVTKLELNLIRRATYSGSCSWLIFHSG